MRGQSETERDRERSDACTVSSGSNIVYSKAVYTNTRVMSDAPRGTGEGGGREGGARRGPTKNKMQVGRAQNEYGPERSPG